MGADCVEKEKELVGGGIDDFCAGGRSVDRARLGDGVVGEEGDYYCAFAEDVGDVLSLG